MKIVVIGAGPAGVSAALCLAKEKKFEVTLIEADKFVGGMAKTFELWGQKVDLGPHRFFTFNKEIENFWLAAIANRLDVIRRTTRIFYNGKLFLYPLQFFDVLRNLGVIDSILCLLSLIKSKVFKQKDESHFAGWVSNRFGSRLYKKFFKTYSEKLWGISCEDLDSEFAVQRIKKLSLFQVLKDLIAPKKLNRHKSLIDTFYYPQGGTGVAYENMAKMFVENGGRLILESKVKSINVNNYSVQSVTLMTDEILQADQVISSMPIDAAIANMKSVPPNVLDSIKKLRFRNTILVYLEIEDSDLFIDQWIYIHSEKMKTGRVTNFRNWSPSICRDQKNTILSLEYWCYSDERIWSEEDGVLFEMAKADIQMSGLIGEKKIFRGKVVRINKCYPVYDRQFKGHMAAIRQYLSSIRGLQVIGRGGSFKYNNQDHSILMGIRAAQNILGSKYDLWSINNDYEYQEEK